MNRMSRTLAVVASAATGAGLLVAASPAANATGIEAHKRGTCTQGSTWELELEKEHGVIDVDFEAETRSAGDRWKVKVKHKKVKNNKKWVYRSHTVSDREGEVDVDRYLKDRAGKDKVVVRVKSTASGEVCKAKLKI